MTALLASAVFGGLTRAVPAHSLAAIRIGFGALMIWDCWRFIRDDRVWRYWIAPEFHFSYPGFSWVKPLPEAWLELAWLGMGVAALFVMLGLFYRIAIVVLTAIFGYFFLLDAAEYLNHFSLVLLSALILCVLPAARVWSLDAYTAPRHDSLEIMRPEYRLRLRPRYTCLRDRDRKGRVGDTCDVLPPVRSHQSPCDIWAHSQVTA